MPNVSYGAPENGRLYIGILAVAARQVFFTSDSSVELVGRQINYPASSDYVYGVRVLLIRQCSCLRVQAGT